MLFDMKRKKENLLDSFLLEITSFLFEKTLFLNTSLIFIILCVFLLIHSIIYHVYVKIRIYI